MLNEVSKEIVLMKNGESNCRWFRDDFFDLFIWYDGCDELISFQLYYDIYSHQRSLFWNKQSGFSHHQVDQGESKPGKPKAAPIVFGNGVFPFHEVEREFQSRSINIDRNVSEFILFKLLEYKNKMV